MDLAAKAVAVGMLYGGLGFVVALGFVGFGPARRLPGARSVTLGARILILPGALLLWPFVLRRWIAGPRLR